MNGVNVLKQKVTFSYLIRLMEIQVAFKFRSYSWFELLNLIPPDFDLFREGKNEKLLSCLGVF